jgi:hypothetical protein
MILYACKAHGPLAEMDVKGSFDLRITCRQCGGPGLPMDDGLPVQKLNGFIKNEQIINGCQTGDT